MLAFETPILFGTAMDEAVRLRNFSPPEDGFIWSGGKWCEVEFDADLGRALRGRTTVEFMIDLDVFKFPPAFPGQNLLVYMNGLRIASSFITTRTVLTMPVRPAVVQPTGNVLVLDIPDAIRPSEFGLEDDRLLGAQLFSLAVGAGG
ncbi:MAG TPA: hypothetical protein VE684_01550 [Crenalkalicoccus sp.]|nr:hypothetical protein [Crenalkalicoccus sp.]